MLIFPISFSIPKEKIVANVTEKTKLLSSIIPGDRTTYIYNVESEYYKEYQNSIFAITTKKAGWDCMRHYEILANGCIPVFPDIENCPPNTMTFLPKDLLIKANNLYEDSKNKQIDYLPLARELLEYTKKYLTTENIANYILEKSGNQDSKKILYLSGDTSPDYLRCITLHGFKKLLGHECHDFPKIEHIYKCNSNYNHLYGYGFTYSGNLDSDLRDSKYDNTLLDDISNKRYDLIIYGNFHRGMPYYDLISSIYDSNKIILICGEDLHNCTYKNYSKHPVFVREL
jgi:hypothetical protein